MSVIINGTEVDEVIYNGVNLDEIYYNDEMVFCLVSYIQHIELNNSDITSFEIVNI